MGMKGKVVKKQRVSASVEQQKLEKPEFVSSKKQDGDADDIDFAENLDDDSDSSLSSDSDSSLVHDKLPLGKRGKKTLALKNRQRVLILGSRGITHRQRHLLQDIHNLLPHSKKESKLDSKTQLRVLNELAELNNCNNALFFEARRHEDLYMWASKTPNGPCCKFQVQNIHTLDELHMTGNHLKGSRHVLSFDSSFDETPHYCLVKELLTHIFAIPKTSRKLKPFIDHVVSFSLVDNRIWVRNYQIIQQSATLAALDAKTGKKKANKEPTMELNEVGPRFCLNLIRIFDKSFGGATLYDNPHYSGSTEQRRLRGLESSFKYKAKQRAKALYEEKKLENELQSNPLDEIFN